MRDFAKLNSQDALADLPRVGGIGLLAGLGLTLVGPFGTDKWDIFVQLGFWTAMSAAWFSITYAVAFGFARIESFRRLSKGRQWMLTFAASVFPAIIISGLSICALHGVWLTQIDVLQLAGHTVVIGIVLEMVNRALPFQAGPAAHQVESPAEGQGSMVLPAAPILAAFPSATPTAESGPLLLKRLPPQTRGPILCLQMEDHYVRVHTETDSALVLMRFSDALSEVDKSAGLRVHRSWWVANEAVRSVTRMGRTAQLELSNSLKVPVSQPYIAAVTALAERRQLRTVDYQPLVKRDFQSASKSAPL
ncbi:MAG: LytTR family DNA-binding domain-containing protein [Parvibaculaceae bacterium]|nr:LytTR family DNA-binding domain-containing protein [Parvibaculaceae bacterium]